MHPSEELLKRFLLARSVSHILVVDRGEFSDEGRDSHSRPDEGLPGLHLLAVLVASQSNLNDLSFFASGLSAKRFEVEDHEPTTFEWLSSWGWSWVFRLYLFYPRSEVPTASSIRLEPFGIADEEPLKTLA
jgi:hypothetical protein